MKKLKNFIDAWGEKLFSNTYQLQRIIILLAILLAVAVVSFAGYYYYDRYYQPQPKIAEVTIAQAEQALREDPQNTEKRLNLAEVYMLNRRFDDAIARAVEVMTVEPDNQRAWLVLGVANALGGNPADAIDPLEKYLEANKDAEMPGLNKSLQSAAYYLGDSYLKLNQPDKAVPPYWKRPWFGARPTPMPCTNSGWLTPAWAGMKRPPLCCTRRPCSCPITPKLMLPWVTFSMPRTSPTWLIMPVAWWFAGSAVLLVWFVARARRHPAPALELSLFRERLFSVAVASTLLFSISFYAMLLIQVLYLINVWQYSVIQAGLGITPAPLWAAIVAAAGGRLADKYGHRPIIAIGTAVFTLGCVGLMSVGAEPSYVREWLGPASLLGVGAGLTLPTLISASVAHLPPTRFAQGSAVNSMVRQIGAALGVAVLIAIVGERGVSQGPDAFRWAWGAIMMPVLAAGALAAALYRVPSRRS